MALITCPECGRRISDQADMCIGCGIPMGKITKMLNTLPVEPDKDVNNDNQPERTEIVLENRLIKCIRCSNRYNISELQCPICRTPAFYLYHDPKKQELQIVNKRQHTGGTGKNAKKVNIQFDSNIKNPINKLVCTIKAVEIIRKRSRC